MSHELGQNIIHDPAIARAGRRRDLLTHFMVYLDGIELAHQEGDEQAARRFEDRLAEVKEKLACSFPLNGLSK